MKGTGISGLVMLWMVAMVVVSQSIKPSDALFSADGAYHHPQQQIRMGRLYVDP